MRKGRSDGQTRLSGHCGEGCLVAERERGGGRERKERQYVRKGRSDGQTRLSGHCGEGCLVAEGEREREVVEKGRRDNM